MTPWIFSSRGTMHEWMKEHVRWTVKAIGLQTNHEARLRQRRQWIAMLVTRQVTNRVKGSLILSRNLYEFKIQELPITSPFQQLTERSSPSAQAPTYDISDIIARTHHINHGLTQTPVPRPILAGGVRSSLAQPRPGDASSVSPAVQQLTRTVRPVPHPPIPPKPPQTSRLQVPSNLKST